MNDIMDLFNTPVQPMTQTPQPQMNYPSQPLDIMGLFNQPPAQQNF